MSRKDDDYIGHVPNITPAHDEIASYKRSQAKGALNAIGEVPNVGSNGEGSSTAVKSILAVVVLILLLTAGWAAYLHQRLGIADQAIRNYELRISDLERQLSVTDESMSESSVAMKVKLRELDFEIRKLWDNVWKKSKERLAEHDALLEKQQKSINAAEAFVASTRSQLAKNDTVVEDLRKQLKATEQMKERVAANVKALSGIQATAESAADKSNRLTSEVAKLERRLETNEEWIESINGFRRQVNRDLIDLQKNVGQIQATPR